MRAWCLFALLLVSAGCASAADYAAARSTWEVRDAQAPAGCPATRRSNGTCIRDGGP